MSKTICVTGDIAYYDATNGEVTHISVIGGVTKEKQAIEDVIIRSAGVNDCTTLIVKDKNNNHFWVEHVSAGDIGKTYGDRLKRNAIKTALNFSTPLSENNAYCVLHHIKNTQRSCELEIIAINNSKNESASILKRRFEEILGPEFTIADLKYYALDRQVGDLHQVEFTPAHADKLLIASDDPEVGPEIIINDDGDMEIVEPDIAWDERPAFDTQDNKMKLK